MRRGRWLVLPLVGLIGGCADPLPAGRPDATGSDIPPDGEPTVDVDRIDAGVDAPDLSLPEVAVDAPAQDVPSVDVLAAEDRPDVAAPDAPDVVDVPADTPPADAPLDVAVPDAGRPGGLGLDAYREWRQLPPAFGISADVTGDGRRDAMQISTFMVDGRVVVTFAVAQADGSFTTARSFSAPGSSGSVLFGDFDGDRRTDVFLRTNSSGGSFIATGHGDGTFEAPQAIAVTGDVVADFDNDGRSDLLYNNSSLAIDLHLRRADGSFATTRLPSSMLRGVPGDFDGDGVLDLAAGTTVFRGLGGGRFASGLAAACAPCPGVGRGRAVRMDGDGRDDLLALVTGQVVVFRARPDGSLEPAGSSAFANSPTRVITGDVDGDGRLDVVHTSSAIGGSPDNQVQVLYGDGAGGFAAHVEYQETRGATVDPVVTDADRDGQPDLVIGGRYVAYGRGNRRLRAPELSAYLVSEGSRRSVTRLATSGPIELVETRATAEMFRTPFRGDRRMGPSTRCDGPGTGADRAFRDFDADGRPDLWLVRDGTLSLWLGAGGCAFGAERRSPFPWTGARFVDVNGDANVDAIITVANRISTAIATAPGVFSTPIDHTFRAPIDDYATADLNADGALDVVAIDNVAHAITVLRGNAAHALTAAQTIAVPGTSMWSPVAGDADGDGDPDVLMLDSTGMRLEMLRNDRTALARVTLVAVDTARPVRLADLDLDGRLEAVVGGRYSTTQVYRVDATSATQLLEVWVPFTGGLYDHDGDGDLDLGGGGAVDGRAYYGVTNNTAIDGP